MTYLPRIFTRQFYYFHRRPYSASPSVISLSISQSLTLSQDISYTIGLHAIFSTALSSFTLSFPDSLIIFPYHHIFSPPAYGSLDWRYFGDDYTTIARLQFTYFLSNSQRAFFRYYFSNQWRISIGSDNWLAYLTSNNLAISSQFYSGPLILEFEASRA